MASNFHHAPGRTGLRVTVKGRNGGIALELENFARQRLSVALCRHVERIRQAEVWIEDVNGPRGGVDKRCRVQLRLHPRGQVTVTAEAANEYAAVAHAARRAATVLDRKGKRTWTTRRNRAPAS